MSEQQSLADWMILGRQRVERTLDQVLPFSDQVPQTLHEAMRYAVLQGGKRIRASLVFAAGDLVEGAQDALEYAAAAIEMIHAYSLVHDDMPCMDNDVLRRGKPTVHIQFGEATALLVGDALQARAFQLLAEMPSVSASARLDMVHVLAKASGSLGMAGGQAIDLASVGQNLTQIQLEQMHRWKTGALVVASTLLGVLSGQTLHQEKQVALRRFAENLGLAFQVADDILDVQADTGTLGKTAGKDAQQNKPTYVGLLGLESAKAYAKQLRQKALTELEVFGAQAHRLRQLADYSVNREY